MKKIIFLSILISIEIFAKVSIGKILPEIILNDQTGGYFNGYRWNSNMLKGKTTMLMYVDPDEKDKGIIFKPIIEKLEQDIDFKKFQIIVILNLNATWKPNFLIKKLSEGKLKTYPKRIYIFDKQSVLVRKWGLTDNEYNVLLIDPQMKPIYSHIGKWKEKEIQKIDLLIRRYTQ